MGLCPRFYPLWPFAAAAVPMELQGPPDPSDIQAPKSVFFKNKFSVALPSTAFSLALN